MTQESIKALAEKEYPEIGGDEMLMAHVDYVAIKQREAFEKGAMLVVEENKLVEALRKIANWELPETGEFWDEEKTRPISYEAEYGSNGARRYIRSIASDALSSLELKPPASESRKEEDGIYTLLELVAKHGGTIESTGKMDEMNIKQARASGRLFVDKDGLGFVWMPEGLFPQTVEEVEQFQKWFPLEVELPEGLKNLDWYNKTKNHPLKSSAQPWDKWIELKKQTQLIFAVYFRPNGKRLGVAYREVDGDYVFWQEGVGAWSDYALRAISDCLSHLNNQTKNNHR